MNKTTIRLTFCLALIAFILALIRLNLVLRDRRPLEKSGISMSRRYPEEFKRLGIKGTDHQRELIAALCRLENRVYVLEQTAIPIEELSNLYKVPMRENI